MGQLVVRIDDGLLDSVDRLIATGEFESRSAATRSALERLVDEVCRRRIGEEIVAGYRRVPQDDGLWSDEATIRMINEEPW